MMAVLGENRYGKAEVRVVRVDRSQEPHGIRDWNVSVSLAGDMREVHLSGANDQVLPTDTQKNTIYVLAQQLGDVEPEVFALALARHFVDRQPGISRARVQLDSYGWNPIGPHSLVRSGDGIRTVTVVHDEQSGSWVLGGLRELTLLNTTDSEFWGFARDDYTTLAETTDRMLATSVEARWRFRDADYDGGDWAVTYDTARQALLDAFTGTYSYSLQQSLYAMGCRVLAEVPQVCEVRLALPNKHHFLVDLSPFGLPNHNEVYLAADRPYGLIEGQVLADDAPEAGPAWS
ncbi:factor-independent urate hydroxylase [Jatrophihabitans sp.]|uniref:factor-independent urate hydroxylase n=1 Tax=Jatrophihabitans sp. TaxID=1932789 RepID=UPI0038CDC25E